MGGGPENAVSLLEVLSAIGELTGVAPALRFAEPRLGDQRYYVTDISRFRARTGFHPRVTWREGIGALHRWFTERRSLPGAAHPGLQGGAQVAP
jgi:CDP-paratose 2-epimerase